MLDVALSGYLGQQPEAYVPEGKKKPSSPDANPSAATKEVMRIK